MTKPHEETWVVDEDGVWCPASRTTVAFGPMAEDSARLVAQAPAMARLLLSYHAVSHHPCPSCGKFGPVEHPERCELQRVLRAAGVL